MENLFQFSGENILPFLYNEGNRLYILVHFLKCCMVFSKMLLIIPGFPSYRGEMGILFQISDAIMNTC